MDRLKNIYYSLYRFYKSVLGIPRDIKHFIQRGRRGYADCDLWGFDYYLAEIIPKAMKYLKENKMGCPQEYFDEGEENDCERWDVELDKIILGFEAYTHLEDSDYIEVFDLPEGETKTIAGFKVNYDHKINEEKRKMWEDQFQVGLKVFAHNYGSYWD